MSFFSTFTVQAVAAVPAAATTAAVAGPEQASSTKLRKFKAVRWFPKWPSLGKFARDDPSWGDPARVRGSWGLVSCVLLCTCFALF